MEKKTIIVATLLIILTGCHNARAIACNYAVDDKSITLNIEAINDDIYSMNVRKCFEIPNVVMCDQEKYSFLLSQLDETYHFEDNLLIKEYDIELNDNYSLSSTIDYLQTKRFYCE